MVRCVCGGLKADLKPQRPERSALDGSEFEFPLGSQRRPVQRLSQGVPVDMPEKMKCSRSRWDLLGLPYWGRENSPLAGRSASVARSA